MTARASTLVTRRQLAELLDVHMQTVTKWEREGLPVAARGRKGKPSKYSEAEARAWLEAREEAAKQPGAALDLVQERARKEHWQALLAEQTHKARERELLPRAEVEKAWGAEVASVRAKLLAWPAMLADRVHRAATLDGLPGVERVLHESVRDVLRDLAGADQAPAPAGKRRGRKGRAA